MTPLAMRSKPPLTRRIVSCASRSPSSEITTVSTAAAMSAACVSISSPVVTSVTRMRSAWSCRHNAQRLRCSSGSPPVSITRCTCSARIASMCRSRSSAEISRLSALAFQMSHITHLQLQALCTLNARIGRLSSRWVTRPRARRAISPGPTISAQPRSRVPEAASARRGGRSIAPPAAGIRRAGPATNRRRSHRIRTASPAPRLPARR